METLIMLTYIGIAWTVFKVFKVPVNKWSLTTTGLIGFFIIFFIIVLMNYNHPFTSNARVYFVTTPIIPNVSAEVIEVKVQGTHQRVSKGDTLFILDHTKYYSRIKVLTTKLKLAERRLEEYKELESYNAGNKFDVENAEENVAQINAQLIEARHDYISCFVKAPADGIVLQNRLRKGMRAVEFPLRPVMNFMEDEKMYLIGAFPQNPMQRIALGDESEIIFDAIPGRVIKGKVKELPNAIAEGELQVVGKLHNFDTRNQFQGAIPVLIEIDDDMKEYYLPGGSKAQIAIYTQYIEPMKLVRKVLLRMKGWLNYLVGE